MFYHVTAKDFGSTVTLTPRVPETQDLSEGSVPRICVAPTLIGCLGSKASTKKLTVMHVLRMSAVKLPFETDAEFVLRCPDLFGLVVYACDKQAYEPPDFSDFRRHGEHWYTTRKKFNRVGYLNMTSLLLGVADIATLNSIKSIELLNMCYTKKSIKS